MRKRAGQKVLELIQQDRTIELHSPKGATLLEALAGEPRVSISAPCGGRGRCGKCLVRVLEPKGGPEPSAADRRFISSEKLELGYRLACTCAAELVSKVEAVGEYRDATVKGDLPDFGTPAEPLPRAAEAGRLAAAVDIGTTTVAVFLIESASGEPVDVLARMNRQSVYGADVLSRIAHSDAGGLSSLSRAIRAQIQEMLTELTERNGGALTDVGVVSFAGNTTMLHFLAAEDPSGIGRAPFTPVFIESREYPPHQLSLPLSEAGAAILLPSVSAYVGADIVSAAVAVDMDRDPRTTLLVDIGTNGELALRFGDRILACSTAAGPAFEGASISAGVGGIAGAIRTWRREGLSFRFDTIAGAEPVGVCGSGLLDLLSTLLKDGVVEETGRMLDPTELREVAEGEVATAYEKRLIEAENGEPAVRMAGPYLFTQKDVREIQLAKAAIAAGIDTLLHHAGIEHDQLERIVLTGGFGHHLDIGSAVIIGLLPEIPVERFQTVSNAAGVGAIEVLRNSPTLSRMQSFQGKVEYLELSGHALFQDRYIERMTFPDVHELTIPLVNRESIESGTTGGEA
ncbi:MAG: ASKHA domain-containing protein [Spirochaetaceae bacterium]